MKKVEVHEQHQANRLLCVFLLALLTGLISPWSGPTGSEATDRTMFSELISRIRGLQDKLDGFSELEDHLADRVVQGLVRDLIKKYYVIEDTSTTFWE